MTGDLTDLMREFPFEPGRVNARLVRCGDGREVLQVRVELGILQMECTGRPDGGEAVLEALQRAQNRVLGAADAAALRLELGQYQHRALAFLAVGEPARALLDAERLLRGTEVVCQRALPGEREWAEGARFSVVVLRTRCEAAALVASGRARDAALAVERGLALLREAAERVGIAESFDSLGDVLALRSLRDTLVPQLPPAQRAELEARLRAAIIAENFELAAILRDELRLL
jgi:hypothetical protein